MRLQVSDQLVVGKPLSTGRFRFAQYVPRDRRVIYFAPSDFDGNGDVAAGECAIEHIGRGLQGIPEAGGCVGHRRVVDEIDFH